MIHSTMPFDIYKGVRKAKAKNLREREMESNIGRA